ncbi:hypothetical protein CS053_08465 [Rhodanobacter glycinis]|uniref:Uncharacterized protein n=1 Tax=Rhodanobacter glycinis TaxID=582702 RepID=A0A5B9E1I9_9GAMM|nr:hypothetical protein [Rhodanobacter glycinis]QEE24531.1 hypothetical protein CS053_08465 [Rhodanobacter glycinis]
MRYVFLALMLLSTAFSVASKEVTDNQKDMLSNMLWDDLTTYLDGGQSMFSDDWSSVATPWVSDQAIGIRYSHGAVSADDFYGNRMIFIQGHYLSAQNWIGDSYRVQMALVVAIVAKSESAFLQDATNGSMVKMACKTAGKEYQYVYVDHCQAQKFAMAELVTREVAVVLSRKSKKDKDAIAIAVMADKKIAADDPCRATFGGCIDDIRSLVH